MAATLAPYTAAGDTWVEVVKKAAAAGADLTATGARPTGEGGVYPIACAACVVVELDVLTGETQILSSDIVYDAGTSINPAVDVGQIEGSFVQATGMLLTEGIVRSKVNGRMTNNGTWDYKPPSALVRSHPLCPPAARPIVHGVLLLVAVMRTYSTFL